MWLALFVRTYNRVNWSGPYCVVFEVDFIHILLNTPINYIVNINKPMIYPPLCKSLSVEMSPRSFIIRKEPTRKATSKSGCCHNTATYTATFWFQTYRHELFDLTAKLFLPVLKLFAEWKSNEKDAKEYVFDFGLFQFWHRQILMRHKTSYMLFIIWGII